MSLQEGRLYSIDALRGFDMMLIMGIDYLVISLCVWMGFGGDCWLAQQMHHVEWHGWHVKDGVFPVFMFLSGLSWPFSFARQRMRGVSDWGLFLKIGKRVFWLFFLGLITEGLFRVNLGWGCIRIGSVFFRIGVCWAFAAVMSMYLRAHVRFVIAVALLIGYWVLISYVPAPDAATIPIPEGLEPYGRGPFSVVGNLSGYVDRMVLPGTMRYPGVFDTQGTLSTIPAIAFPLFGTIVGEFIRCESGGWTGNRKTVVLLAVGALFIMLGLLWSLVFPINRSLWTSSHVVFSSGYAILLFAVFYWIVDVKGYRRWTFVLRVVGMNSLLMFLAQRFSYTDLIEAPTHAVLDGFVALCPKDFGEVVFYAGYVVISWSCLYFLYRKGVFLKV